MPISRGILIAADSVGIDPLGHNRPESVYSESKFLFPRGRNGAVLSLPNAPVEGALVETDVTNGSKHGAIECAVTYASIFAGQSALARHGLVQGLGLKDRILEEMIAENNLFQLFPDACLANAMFPAHLPFLGSSYAGDLVPHYSREQVDGKLKYKDAPIRLGGKDKHGFAELFTLAEINQNIFVHAARQAGVRLLEWKDVRSDQALTSSMTHELESDFDFRLFGEGPLPHRRPEDAARVLVDLAARHRFVFYKYQIPDLVSHTGQAHLCRDVFHTFERFVETVLQQIHAQETCVVVTSDHGHLEQTEFHRGHPKSNVPTWCFAPRAAELAAGLTRPEAIFHLFKTVAAN